VGKINTFFSCLIKSFSSPAYYRDILNARFSFSLKYFLIFFFFYAVVGTVFVGIKTIPPLSHFIKVFPSRIEAVYPQELEIYLKDGTISTNVQEPYALPLNKIEEIFSEQVLGDSTMAGIINLVVIDTQNGNTENFSNYQTVSLVTKKNIIMMDKDGVLKVYSIDPSINLTVNKALVSQIIGKVAPYLNYLTPLMVAAVFLALLTFPSGGYMFYLVFFAFVLWLFSRIVKSELSYTKSYQLGLHMCTITATLFGLLTLLNLEFSFPFAQTIILLIFSYFVLAEIKKSRGIPASSVPPVTSPQAPPSAP
jgi:hypothetical protein